MDSLKQLLNTINVTYNETNFETKDGIAGLGPEPFVSGLIDKLISRPMIYLVMFLSHLVHRIPTSEYTSLQPTLHMQDLCSVR